MLRSALLVGLLAVFPVAANALPICKEHSGNRSNCVVDGDTLWVGRTKVRIENLNAPEIGDHVRCPLELKRGLAAQQHLGDLTDRGEIIVAPSGDTSYDRVLARVFVNGRDVGEQMVEDGYALPWKKKPPYPDWCSNDPR